MSCWVCDKANGTCEHENGSHLTPETAILMANEEIERLKSELRVTENKHKVACDDAMIERDSWKRQAEDWQKRGWEIGKQADSLQGFVERAIRLLYRFRQDAINEHAPWLKVESFMLAMAERLDQDWAAYLLANKTG